MGGKDNDSYIFGGDIRLFDVSVDEERVELAEKIQQAKPVNHRLLVFDDILFTKETIRYMPTFFDYFSGISVDGEKLLQADSCGKDLLQDAGRSTVVCRSISKP